MSSVIRVAVLDAHEVVHFGVRAFFSEVPDMLVTGVYFRSDSALQAIAQGGIDLLLMCPMYRSQGDLDFIRHLHVSYSALRILVFLADPCATVVSLLQDAGVHGIIGKHQTLHDCVQAVRALAAGQSYYGPDIGCVETRVAPPVTAGIQDAEAILLSFPTLSLREREVLRLCIGGLTVTCIAEQFGRSSKTVSTQKQAAYRKLGLKSDMDLFRRLARYEV